MATVRVPPKEERRTGHIVYHSDDEPHNLRGIVKQAATPTMIKLGTDSLLRSNKRGAGGSVYDFNKWCALFEGSS